MRVGVTGAGGHLGANLVRSLLARDYSVVAMVHRDRRALDGLDVEVRPIELTARRSVVGACRDLDLLIHSAAFISLDHRRLEAMYRVNVDGTKTIIEACTVCGIKRLVYIGSIDAMRGRPRDEATCEQRELVTNSKDMAYGWTKAMAETEIRNAIRSGLDAVIVSPTAIVGPYDCKPSFIGQVLIALYTHRMPALVRGGFNWVDARDLADSIVKIAVGAPAGEKYLVAGEWASLRHIAGLIPRHRPLPIVPLWLARAGVGLLNMLGGVFHIQSVYTRDAIKAIGKHRYVSCAKAQAEFGYRPRALAVTIKDTLNWFKENGYLG